MGYNPNTYNCANYIVAMGNYQITIIMLYSQ